MPILSDLLPEDYSRRFGLRTSAEVQPWEDAVFSRNHMEVSVIRLDQTHPWVQGNKAWKLLRYIQEAENRPGAGFVSPGGAYSNHLAALGWLSSRLNRKSLFLIRGDEKEWTGNPLVALLREWGHDCKGMSRTTFRELHQGRKDWRSLNLPEIDRIYVPMGGSSEEICRGSAEGARAIARSLTEPCCLVLPVGTGGTYRGMAEGWPEGWPLVGIPVLKTNQAWGQALLQTGRKADRLIPGYEFGGYGKTNAVLEQFRKQFLEKTGIPTEPCYSAKTFFAVKDLVEKGLLKGVNKILVLHSGGIFPWNTNRKSG